MDAAAFRVAGCGAGRVPGGDSCFCEQRGKAICTVRGGTSADGCCARCDIYRAVEVGGAYTASRNAYARRVKNGCSHVASDHVEVPFAGDRANDSARRVVLVCADLV